jgi:hypothetical protein
MSQHSSHGHEVNPSEFPRLSELARGYLHQDLIPEYGSALQATLAFLKDLPASGRKEAAAEAFRFREIIHEWRNAAANEAFASLGSSWIFIARDELNEVLQTIERGH